MKPERFTPSPEERADKRPQPKRTRRGAALLAAGLSFGAGISESAQSSEPSNPAPTEQTDGSKKIQDGLEVFRKFQEEDAAQIKEQKLRTDLEKFQWVGGVMDITLAKPEDLSMNTLTPEYIDWLIKNNHAETLLQYNPVTESEQFNNHASLLGSMYLSETRRDPLIHRKMDPSEAKIYIQYLKDSKFGE